MNYSARLFFGLLLAAGCQSDPKPRAVLPPAATNKPVPIQPGTAEVPEPLFMQEGELEFRTPDGQKTLLRLDIEIAVEAQERSQGLMWRKKMEDKQAMIFLFDYPQPQSFWMRNTYIPLDIIFVNEKFEVVTVLKNIPVLNDLPRPSGKPAQYVIEVNAGVASKYSIVPGMKVAWNDFTTGQQMGQGAAVEAFQ